MKSEWRQMQRRWVGHRVTAPSSCHAKVKGRQVIRVAWISSGVKWGTTTTTHISANCQQQLFKSINSFSIWNSHSSAIIHTRLQLWTWLTNLATDSRIDLTLESPSLPKYTTVRWILLSWWIHTSLTGLKNKVHSGKYRRHYSFRRQSYEAL